MATATQLPGPVATSPERKVPTPRQKQCLDAIVALNARGVGASIREIATALEVTDSTAFKLVSYLIAKGYVQRKGTRQLEVI